MLLVLNQTYLPSFSNPTIITPNPDEEQNVLVLSNEQIRAIILFNFKLGKSAKDCLENMQIAFGSDFIKKQQSTNSTKGFKITTSI